MLGVEFSKFEYFHLLTFDDCERSAEFIEKQVRSSGLSLSVSKDDADNRLIGYAGEPGIQNFGTSAFIHFRSVGDVGPCLIEFQPHKTKSVDFAASFSKKVGELIQKFKVPVADIGGENETFFILLSRECSARSSVADNLLAFLGEGGEDLNVVPNPDAKLFLNTFAHGSITVSVHR
jgi:hypothetical protein